MLKVKAHLKGDSSEVKGNTLADQAAAIAATRTAKTPTGQTCHLCVTHYSVQFSSIFYLYSTFKKTTMVDQSALQCPEKLTHKQN